MSVTTGIRKETAPQALSLVCSKDPLYEVAALFVEAANVL